MNRKKRTQVMIEYGREDAKMIADRLQQSYAITVDKEPQDALVMVKVRESAQNSLFYIGEVLVTECKVRLDGHAGTGIVQGHEADLAFALAVIDAAYEADVPEVEDITRRLQAIEKTGNAQKSLLERRLTETKVQFENMYQE